MKGKNPEQAAERVERELATVQRKIANAEGRMDRLDEQSYEYTRASQELRTLRRCEHKLMVELEDLEAVLA